MTAPPGSLDSLRRQIDAIDDEMHDLFIRRSEIVERIGALKSREANPLYIRPAREARILRRLVDRHRGRIPAAVVVRIWREMMAATSRLQGPFTVAVCMPETSVGYWDLARDHYGSGTPMTVHRAASAVIRAVADGSTTVGVLPPPETDDGAPWWPQLLAFGEAMPRVIAQLPFIDAGGARDGRPAALAIARTERGETGDDVSLIAVDADAELSRASLVDAFAAAGLAARNVGVWRDGADAATRLHLLAVDGFVGGADSRLDAAAAGAGGHVGRIVGLGGYAVPIAAADAT